MTGDPDEMNRILEETKQYYRQRASQYMDWAHRDGKYEGSSEPDASEYNDAKMVLDALERAGLQGSVLEIACGTGILTKVLARTAGSVTALDSSREMLERCRTRLGANHNVRYVHADFYDWTPDQAYDAVSFSFWISHVPAYKLDEFVSKLSGCLKPGGRVFFVDQQTHAIKYEVLEQPGGEVASRTLEDGRRFRVFKHFYTPEEITESFRAHGIKTRLSKTPNHFFYVNGEKIR